MIPANWTDLQTKVATLSIRDDLADLIPDFIGFAENWMQRELFSPEREASVNLTVVDGVADLPSDFAGLKMVFVDGDTDNDLDQVTPSRLRQLYPTTTAGIPYHFAIEGETILFGPQPSDGVVLVLKYIEGIPKLGSLQPTNWLLTDHPDLYVNAALAELYEYTRDYDEANRRRTLASGIADSIAKAGRRRKTNSGPLVASNPVAQTTRFARA
jgi:hypothetical protein